MCGRYTLNSKQVEIAKHYHLKKINVDIRPNYNVAPTQTMPVIVNEGEGAKLELMRWGIPRFIPGGKVIDVFNTRADKAFGSWKKLTLGTRCLIPASGYYEWKKDKEAGKPIKKPFYFHPKQQDLFSFAGVWNQWKDDKNNELKVYSIITTEPNKEAAEVHNRMPVILHREDEASWLDPSHNGDQKTLESFLHPYEDNGLDVYEVSRDVNVARTNDKHLILPINSQ